MIRALVLSAALAVCSPAIGHADLYSAMTRFEGMTETRNRQALKRMLGIDPRRVPWCGAMLTYVARKAGKRVPAGSLKALAWRHYGHAVKPSGARRGDVAVVRGGRHVIVFTNWRGGKACGIGGNTSNGVKRACYSGLVAVRR